MFNKINLRLRLYNSLHSYSKNNELSTKIHKRILKSIKYFSPRTKTTDIHSFFNLHTIEQRTAFPFRKFAIAKLDNELISSELEEFINVLQTLSTHTRPTAFDLMLRLNC